MLSKRVLIPAGAVGLVVVLVLAFGVFGIHTLFIDKEVNEAGPFQQVATEQAADESTNDAGTEAETEEATDGTVIQTASEVLTIASGSFIDIDHSGDGTANVITDGNQTFLRFESDFDIDNGPDLNVYLSRGVDADSPPGTLDDDFIDLGDLKGNIGSQNYELPEGIDIAEYDTVVIWCVRFGVAFNAANLA